MRARGLLALALIAAFGSSTRLSAQGGSIGTRPPATTAARPGGTRPAPGQNGAPVRRPVGTITTLPALRGGYAHRTCIIRSPILGFFAFDPYWWVAPDAIDPNMPMPPPPPPGPRLMGGLQLDVEPRRALVYLDGVLIGTVDQFKGYFQHLETTAGYHIVEFISPDYDPLVTEVTVAPNKTTTYRASMSRAGGR